MLLLAWRPHPKNHGTGVSHSYRIWEQLSSLSWSKASQQRLSRTLMNIKCCCCCRSVAVPTLCDPWTAAHQASLSLTISWGLPKFMLKCFRIFIFFLGSKLNISLRGSPRWHHYFLTWDQPKRDKCTNNGYVKQPIGNEALAPVLLAPENEYTRSPGRFLEKVLYQLPMASPHSVPTPPACLIHPVTF